MDGCCRIGDLVTGTCEGPGSDHPRQFTGFWTTGSSNVTANTLGIIRVGDIGLTDCNHTFQAVSGSNNVTSNGIGLVRVGDPVVVIEGGSGTAITGSSNVTSS